jgi:hypothetical protein
MRTESLEKSDVYRLKVIKGAQKPLDYILILLA